MVETAERVDGRVAAAARGAAAAGPVASEAAVGLLTRDQVLGADDIETERVEVREWGGAVLVRGLSGAERDRFEDETLERRGKKGTDVRANLANIRARLIALSVVSEDGKLLFTQADVKALGNKSAAALARVYDVAARLSGLTDEDVDELAGNFTGEAGGSSSST